MKSFTAFTHPTYGTIRALIHDHKPWFVASDVCRILALPARKPTLDQLDPSDSSYIEVSNGGGYIVSRSGVYALALESSKSYAKAFTAWLSTDVIPSLSDDPDSDFLTFSNPEPAPEPQPVRNTEAAEIINLVNNSPAAERTTPTRSFAHPEFGSLDIITIDGKEYFPATECAKILGYSNPRDAISKHCKAVAKRDTLEKNTNRYGTTTEQVVEKSFIPEGDLYRLIARSKLPAAEKFERWVFDEVLPSIRKHGAYMTQPVLQQMLDNPNSIIQLASTLLSEHQRAESLQQQVDQQNHIIAGHIAEIEEMRPKVSYLDTILQNKRTVPVSVIAKDYGMSAVAFNKMLHELGIQYRCGKTWLLYSKYASEGYTSSYLAEKDGDPVGVQTNWTQKGRLFLYENLKARKDLVPLIERESA